MFGDRSFAITAPRRWNTLAKGIRDTNSLVNFNTLLKTHFCLHIYGHKLFVFWTMHRHCQTRLLTVLLKSCRFLILFSVVFSCISCLNYNDTVLFTLETVILEAAMLNSHLLDSVFYSLFKNWMTTCLCKQVVNKYLFLHFPTQSISNASFLKKVFDS